MEAGRPNCCCTAAAEAEVPPPMTDADEVPGKPKASGAEVFMINVDTSEADSSQLGRGVEERGDSLAISRFHFVSSNSKTRKHTWKCWERRRERKATAKNMANTDWNETNSDPRDPTGLQE